MALRKGIIDMYEAAFGTFNVVKSEGIRDAAKFKAVRFIERSCIERNDSVPTALHRYRMT